MEKTIKLVFMKVIHLTRSADLPVDRYNLILNLLSSDEDAPIQFRSYLLPLVDFGNKLLLTWEEIFLECCRFRLSHSIPDDDFVFLLTEKNNDKHWFTRINHDILFDGFNHTGLDGFVHTGGFNFDFIETDVYPIAFEIVCLFLFRYMLNYDTNYARISHDKAIGCINDMCINKEDVRWKIKVCDICTSCTSVLIRQMPIEEFDYAVNLIEALRNKMLWRTKVIDDYPLSDMIIEPKNGLIRFPGFRDISIRLSAKFKAVYMLFLNHPEGLDFDDVKLLKNELKTYYFAIKRSKQGKDLDDFINGVVEYDLSEVLSKIRGIFEVNIGPLYDKYAIMGSKGEKRLISIDRNKVQINGDWRSAPL
jgi:hypothetical protein